MHNIIQELRGNVRVFARIRPFIPDDGKQGKEADTSSVSHDGDAIVIVVSNIIRLPSALFAFFVKFVLLTMQLGFVSCILTYIIKNKPNDPTPKHTFSFDRVFAPSAGQDTVYQEVSQFIQSALDGYKVCLFSYGQTGSGKTHTMQGAGTGVMRGLIPRSIEQIGTHKNQMQKEGWKFYVVVSFLEIYNEMLRDLLRENPKKESKHEIKVGEGGRRTVTNLTVLPIDPNDLQSDRRGDGGAGGWTDWIDVRGAFRVPERA